MLGYKYYHTNMNKMRFELLVELNCVSIKFELHNGWLV